MEKKEIMFQNVIENVFKRSTIFNDSVDQTQHLLFKGNESQDSREIMSKLGYCGRAEFVSRISYMAHNKITTISKGLMVRHKCKYKHLC